MKRKPIKKATKKKIVKKAKVTRKKVSKRKNPYSIKTYTFNNLEYIKLSDFEFQFQREYDNIYDEGYHDWSYEIDVMLTYEFRNSNKVNSGVKNLISLEFFKTLVNKKLLAYEDPFAIEAFKNTIDRIPDKVTLIDTGN